MEKTGNIINLSDTINLYNIFSTWQEALLSKGPLQGILKFLV